MASCFVFSRGQGHADDSEDDGAADDYDDSPSSASSSSCFTFSREKPPTFHAPPPAAAEPQGAPRTPIARAVPSRQCYGTGRMSTAQRAAWAERAGWAEGGGAAAAAGADGHGHTSGTQQQQQQQQQHDEMEETDGEDGQQEEEEEERSFVPLTHLLVEFAFDSEGPLGLSFLKRKGDGAFRVGAVREGCAAQHVRREGRLPGEAAAAAAAAAAGGREAARSGGGAAAAPRSPPRPGTLRVAVGDRIVAVNGVLVDGAAMDQKALGNLIRRAPRPVRLTCEPQSLREAHEGKYTRS
jgi:hypothetical protein